MTAFDRVKTILEDRLAISDITEDTNLETVFSEDDYERLMISLDLEDEFGANISDSELDRIKTVGDLVRLVDPNH
jgi:acyl carrier protein